ncbi:MAG: hypothetical protein WCY38_06330, partial [Endomicrobiia bacterium]
MKKTNIISSFFVMCLFVMLSASEVFADNLTDKHVYSLFTENFNGATQDAGTVNDNITYNAWNGGGNAKPTADIITDSTAKEGNSYYGCGVSSTSNGWSGFCYTFITGAAETPTIKDISAFSTLEFYIRPKTGDVSSISVGITEGLDITTDRTVSLSSLGVDNNSHTWQKCTIDLTNLPSVDLTNIKNTFLVVTSNQAATFDLDGIVLKRSIPGEFNVTIKNISDDMTTSSITWSTTSFRQNWVAAEQYVELSLDIFESDNWTVRIYTDNGDVGKNGLVDTLNGTRVLQMCWRISKNLLPNADGDTLQITKSGTPNYALYDSGKSATDP